MLIVSAAEFQQNIAQYQELALHEPISVTRNGAESCVLLSTDEYRRLKGRDCEVLSIGDFSEADAEAVRRSQAPAEAAAFDYELTT